MGDITVGDYVSQSQHEISASDINDRIEALKATIRECQQDNQEPDEDDERELAALIEFRDEVQRTTGNHFDEATIVPEDEFRDWARDWAHGIGDFEFLDKYVRWKEFAEDLRGDYTALDFGDDLVYVR